MDVLKIFGWLIVIFIAGFILYFFVWSFVLAILGHLLMWGIPIGSVIFSIIVAFSGTIDRTVGNLIVGASIVFCILWFKFDLFEKLGFEKIVDWIDENIPIK